MITLRHLNGAALIGAGLILAGFTVPAAARDAQSTDQSRATQPHRDTAHSDRDRRQICVRDTLSGSRMVRRICKTPEEWEADGGVPTAR